MNDIVKYEVDTVEKWGDFAKKSGVLPSNCNQYQAAAIVQTGRELGLAPMQSIRSMCFVNGRLTMSVQLQLALAKNKGVKIIDLKETDSSCKVTLERDGEKVTCEFTAEDAKKAGLDTKDNWKKYGKQMYRWRAIGDALRLIAPDLVMGLLDPIEAASIESPATPVAAKTVEAEVVADPVVVSPPPTAVETQPTPPPPATTAEPTQADVEAELSIVLCAIADHIGSDAASVLYKMTVNKDGKYGRRKIEQLQWEAKKKDGSTWYPMKTLLSRAKAQLAEYKSEPPVDDDIPF